MRTIFIVSLVLFFIYVPVASAQDKLIILVRHAEKVDETSQDPDLSPAGRERAQRLIKAIGKYRPGAFHSTDFKRTRDTLAPLAQKRNKKVELYDARQPQQLFDSIVKSDIKRHVVSGHSNTVPGLANVITKKDLFKNLQDSEYTVIWKIRMKNGKITSVELLEY
jgi:broad specificity phosphatase PhoE